MSLKVKRPRLDEEQDKLPDEQEQQVGPSRAKQPFIYRNGNEQTAGAIRAKQPWVFRNAYSPSKPTPFRGDDVTGTRTKRGTSAAMDDLLGGDDGDDSDVLKPTQPAEDKYSYLKNLSAKDLLDANVMTQISNEVARKNMRSDLAALGLENSGYAGTASALRENANQARMMENQRAFNDALLALEEKQRSEQEQQDAELLSGDFADFREHLSTFENQEQIDNYLQSEGWTYDDETGRWSNDRYTQQMNDMVNRDLNSINAMFNQGKTPSGSEVEALNGGSSFKDEYGAITSIKPNKGSADDLAWEIFALFDQYKNPQDGFTVKLTNGSDKNKTAVVVYDAKSGSWKQVADGYYDSVDASMKGEIKSAGRPANASSNAELLKEYGKNPTNGTEFKSKDGQWYKFYNGNWYPFTKEERQLTTEEMEALEGMVNTITEYAQKTPFGNLRPWVKKGK